MSLAIGLEGKKPGWQRAEGSKCEKSRKKVGVGGGEGGVKQ